MHPDNKAVALLHSTPVSMETAHHTYSQQGDVHFKEIYVGVGMVVVAASLPGSSALC